MRMPVLRRAGVTVGCAGLALLLGACSSGSANPGGTSNSPAAKAPASNGIAAKSTAKIVKTAYTALESAVSVRMYGSFRDSGARYKMDLTMSPAGMRGSMTAPFQGKKIATVDIVVLHGKFYARSRTLWRQVGGAGMASLIGDRWVILPTGSVSGFPFGNSKSFLKLLNDGGLKSLRKAKAKRVRTTVNGQPAIELFYAGSAVYIATTGNPYPLEIKQGSSALYFAYSGTPASITAPPNAVDLSKLKG